ncbi:MAG: hypothetical protein MPW14_08585 [Candidatus Manganitrophus sp.]|nr:hypothetical protein [Candidatus Manganitrophus sp.]MDC4227886.1 hypothetical protein [Candidatus Manganitrophus sp.]WDT70971.1 MAG: hypothetical protein MPW17_19840 [Candidatus Manganitrophus sp.]WDT81754.1 MAG: hypothetical protein MPW14_08585 [Candidatus Manganitrophus sp.]
MKAKIYTVHILFQFREPAFQFEEAWFSRQTSALIDIVSLSGRLKASVNDYINERVFNIRMLSESELESEYLDWKPSSPSSLTKAINFTWHYLLLESTATVDFEKLLHDSFPDAPERSKYSQPPLDEELAVDLLSTDLEKFSGDLILAAAIAKPGGLEPLDVVLYVNRKKERSIRTGPHDLINLVVDYAVEVGWPKLHEINIEEAWQWISRIPGLENGVPQGDVGRAISALSHVIGEDYSAVQLMWCMVGLEALYLKGKQGLSEQLFEKVQTLLGPVNEHKRAFRGLYDYRSKFVHGDLDIPLIYTPYDGAEEFEKFYHETFDAMKRAAALLLATLQKMVELRIYSLEFRYILEEKEQV